MAIVPDRAGVGPAATPSPHNPLHKVVKVNRDNPIQGYVVAWDATTKSFVLVPNS